MPGPGEPEFRALPGRPRPAKLVIDQAIRDNKISEWLLYGYASLFVLAGVTALIWGMIRGEGTVALAGSVASVLFYPAFRQAREIRREKLAVRLLEAPLSMAHSEKQAADAPRDFFAATFVERTVKS